MIRLDDGELDNLQQVAIGNLDKMLFPKQGLTLAQQSAYALQSMAASNAVLVELKLRHLERIP